jgi:hypothetical protein
MPIVISKCGRRAKILHLVEIGEVGTNQGAHAARDVRKQRCVDARKQ